MLITKIEVQKRNKNRANLYLDDEFYCGLSVETIMKNRIKEGLQIQKDTVDYLINQTEKEMALNKAISYISKCQKTKKEIHEYLLKKGFNEVISNEVIEKMQEYNFVNDDYYAKNYIKFKNKNSGKKKIEVELKQKGVDEKIIKQATDKYINDREYIVLVAKKYMKNKEYDIKNKQKAFRYLVSRGYQTEDIKWALEQIFKKDEDDYECWY